MNELFIELTAKVLAMLLITMVTVAGTWMTTQAAKRNELGSIAAATDEAVEAAQRVVTDLQQTVVGKLKDASADGKLTDAEIDQLKALLLEKALAQLSEPAKKILIAAGKDLCAIIQSAGEAMVLAIKSK